MDIYVVFIVLFNIHSVNVQYISGGFMWCL